MKKGDGIAIGTQQDRHILTRTYKNGNKEVLKQNETPREALARDIVDYKKYLRIMVYMDKKLEMHLKKLSNKIKKIFQIYTINLTNKG